MMKLDILAIGAHPDDVELSASGTIMIEIAKGKSVGIVDLTEGELGTRGSVEERYAEAAASAKILGIAVRENLQLPDGFFENKKEHQLKVIEAIRHYQPEILLCNAPEDRHPDHGRGSELVSDAAFLAGLRQIKTQRKGVEQAAWRPKYVLQYIQDRFLMPNFVVDITAVHDKKIESIKAFASQFFTPGAGGPQTYISRPDFLEGVIYRSKMMGKMIGVPYAEGFISKKMLGFESLDALVLRDT
jgi:bacillithiol biosynthesis deacetylase BshB1